MQARELTCQRQRSAEGGLTHRRHNSCALPRTTSIAGMVPRRRQRCGATAEPDRPYIAPTENPIGWTINESYGIGQGNTISMALPKPVELPLKEDGTRMSYEELLDSTAATRKTLQLQAAVNLTNISGDERAARGRAGKALLVVAAAAAAAAAALHLGPGARAAALGVPFWLGYSLIESSRQGICSIAQAGAWDVDGCGLQYIEDASLASKIRAKVNNMYIQSVVVAGTMAGAFALLPLPQ